MKYCESCFAVGLDDDLFCPNCGQEYSSVHLGSDPKYSKELGIKMRSLLDPPNKHIKRRVVPLSDPSVFRDVPLIAEDRRDVKIKREIIRGDVKIKREMIRGDGSNIDDFIKASYPGLYESTFSDIADAYVNTTTATNFEWEPDKHTGMLKLINPDPEQIRNTMEEWQEQIKMQPGYIPMIPLPENKDMKFVQFDKPQYPLDLEIKKKKTLRQRLRTGVAWGLLFAIALLVVSLLNIQLTGTI